MDDFSADSSLEATEPLSFRRETDRSRHDVPRVGPRCRGKQQPTPGYCGDCGARLPPGSTRGCCLHRDRRFGQVMPAEVLAPLEWEELESEEQALVIGLISFPGGEARETELAEKLNWSSERLYVVAAPRMRQAAEFACCVYAGDTFHLTDQARDAFLAHDERRWTGRY